MNIYIDNSTLSKINQLLDAGLVLEAIKLVRSYSGCGLSEAKEYIDTYLKDGMAFSKGTTPSVDEFDIANESYTDYLKRHTKPLYEVESEKRKNAEQSWKNQIDKQMVCVCKEIMRETLKLAQNGHTQLQGVLTRPGTSDSGWFVAFTNVDSLQLIKANTDNDYRTSFFTFDQAQYVKAKLQEELRTVGISGQVAHESAYYYIDSYRLQGGFFRSKEVKERKWYGDKNRFVVIFHINW